MPRPKSPAHPGPLTSRPKNLPPAGHKAVRHPTCFKWPGHPPSDSQPVTWRGRRPKGHRCQVFRLRTTVYLPCKVTRTLLGDGGRPAASRPLLPRTPAPALSPGPPHLSGQQEFPFFSLPQLHHVRQGLNRCTDTKKHTAFVRHGKETLPVSSPVPPVPPACPKQVCFSSLAAEATPRG